MSLTRRVRIALVTLAVLVGSAPPVAAQTDAEYEPQPLVTAVESGDGSDGDQDGRAGSDPGDDEVRGTGTNSAVPETLAFDADDGRNNSNLLWIFGLIGLASLLLLLAGRRRSDEDEDGAGSSA